MRRYRHPATGDIKLADVLHALSDDTRLGMVARLMDGQEYTSGELSGETPKSTASHHTKILREAGVTRTRSESTRCWISLRRDDLDARYPGLLKTLVGSFHAEQAGGGQAGGGQAGGGQAGGETADER
ncbi:ArsR/SmtB family transcription factor [Streptomyces sp. NPDC091266]|uniref:ArsR/SmtB family transcription factor n=1 Tax=Streptomyces sp. NPDC091266 TaxID=3365978 RepID=UPI003814C30B